MQQRSGRAATPIRGPIRGLIRGLILVLALMVGLAGCGSLYSSGSDPAGQPAAPAATTPAAEFGSGYGDGDDEQATPGGAAALAVADTDLGEVLTDANGQVLYGFASDQDGTSSCYEDCATSWPPLLADTDLTVQDGLDASLVGATQRQDGTTQVTYNNHPLYYFAADQQPGQTSGQGVGGVWWVLSPDGQLRTD